MDGIVARWYVLVIVGLILFFIGTFVYKEGSRRWLIANSDLMIVFPGLAMYVTGLCMLFSQI